MFTLNTYLIRVLVLLLVFIPMAGQQLVVHSAAETVELNSLEYSEQGIQCEQSSSDPQDNDELAAWLFTGQVFIQIKKHLFSVPFDGKRHFNWQIIRAPPSNLR